MDTLSQHQQQILKIFLQDGSFSSSIVHEKIVGLGVDISLVTVKRELSQMKSAGLLSSQGAGRSVEYEITPNGRLNADVDAHEYNLTEPDKRYGLKSFNFELFDSIEKDFYRTVQVRGR